MARSIKKGPFVDEHLMKKVEAQEGIHIQVRVYVRRILQKYVR
jgi:ribosomal protein S19